MVAVLLLIPVIVVVIQGKFPGMDYLTGTGRLPQYRHRLRRTTLQRPGRKMGAPKALAKELLKSKIDGLVKSRFCPLLSFRA
jgi:hypothetical protein